MCLQFLNFRGENATYIHEYQSFKTKIYKGHKGANDKENQNRMRGMENRIREKEKKKMNTKETQKYF